MTATLKAAAMMSGRRGNAARRANKGLAGLSDDSDVVEVPDWGAVWLGVLMQMSDKRRGLNSQQVIPASRAKHENDGSTMSRFAAPSCVGWPLSKLGAHPIRRIASQNRGISHFQPLD
jgi:hypothetical protein